MNSINVICYYNFKMLLFIYDSTHNVGEYIFLPTKLNSTVCYQLKKKKKCCHDFKFWSWQNSWYQATLLPQMTIKTWQIYVQQLFTGIWQQLKQDCNPWGREEVYDLEHSPGVLPGYFPRWQNPSRERWFRWAEKAEIILWGLLKWLEFVNRLSESLDPWEATPEGCMLSE